MSVSIQLSTKPTARLAGNAEFPDRLALDAGEQYRFAFDMRACIGCHSCEAACSEQNALPDGVSWRRVGEVQTGEFPTTRSWSISMACNHCLEPSCLQGCPTNAYEKLDSGIVAHHPDECIGCQYCTWNCPYSVPVFQPDRRIVTKCDMCRPRLDVGLEPACVGACPTKAITVEKVNVAEWRADHHEADAPNLPSSDITLSTTRIVVPDGADGQFVAASDHRISPEHPHWPLVWLTVLSQWATGTTIVAALTDRRPLAMVAALIAAIALAGSLAHLGRPIHAWKALRNLRRSWLSREVLLLGLYAAAAAVHGVTGFGGYVAGALGLAGTYASARLYTVPGRPSWNSWLTIPSFVIPGLALGALSGGALRWGAALLTVQLAVRAANVWRLRCDDRREWTGSARLLLHTLRRWTTCRALLTGLAIAAALTGFRTIAVITAVAGEVLGRYLFYVTVVPMNMPGSFWRERR